MDTFTTIRALIVAGMHDDANAILMHMYANNEISLGELWAYQAMMD